MMGGLQFTRRAWLAGMAGALAGTAWPSARQRLASQPDIPTLAEAGAPPVEMRP